MTSIDAITEYLSSYNDYSYLVLRLGLGLVVFLVGLHKIFSPELWASYIAPWAASLLGTVGVSGTLFMQVSAIGELLFGLAILADIYTTAVSGLVALTFLSIIINLATAGAGYTDIIIRDIGLFLLAVGVTLQSTRSEHEAIL